MTWQGKDVEVVINDVPIPFSDLKLYELFEDIETGELGIRISGNEAVFFNKKEIRNVSDAMYYVFRARYRGL